MMADLEELIRHRQDELRGRPQTRWEIFYARHVAGADWGFIGFSFCLVVWGCCYEFVLIAEFVTGQR